MPSSAAPYRFGRSRRTDHAVAMPDDKHSSVRPRTEPLLSRDGSCYRARRSQQMGLTRLAHLARRASGRHVGCPVPDHRKLFRALIAVQDANALTIDEADIMDLTTLVTACALAVDPKIMHALIWHQSGGEPWSFTVAGVHQPQVFREVSDAVDAAHETYPAHSPIRIR